MNKRHVMILLSAILLAGCRAAESHPLLTPSAAAPVEDYAAFDDYVEKTERMIAANRYFLTADRQKEIAANLPFELRPVRRLPVTKGVLLIHGLGDSPFSFVDIGQALAARGLLVRTLLLPGHGTRPADMIAADHRDWRAAVARHVDLLKQEVEEIYLGGFSTGANLAYLQAAEDPEIEGLMLFSPAFQSDEPLVGLTPLYAFFQDWLLTGDPENETNIVRYMSMPTNGFAQFYRTSQETLERLGAQRFERPVFMALSEHDSVLDAAKIRSLFEERFSHPASRLMWFGSAPSGRAGRIRSVNSRVPALRVSNMSHMGVLFAPENPYYGVDGSQRICRNGQEAPGAEAFCRAGGPVWFSTWGFQEDGKVHARLTFNPAFRQMMAEIAAVFGL